MSFANHNILDIALSIIPPTVVQIRKALGVSVNDYGQANASYGEWREVYGIVQPGGESNEHTQGIDFSKKHVRIWLRGVDLTGTHIQEAPDQIRYIGRIYNVISVDDWFPYDNYRMCECVEALNLGENQKGKVISAKPRADRRRVKPVSTAKPKSSLANSPLQESALKVDLQPELPLDKVQGIPQSLPVTVNPVKPIVKKAMIRF